MEFLRENLGTIITGIVVLVIAGSIIFKLIRDKRQGKSSCGCGCENCANSAYCHSSKK